MLSMKVMAGGKEIGSKNSNWGYDHGLLCNELEPEWKERFPVQPQSDVPGPSGRKVRR
jgi:hypothetical protein